jgi:hypothetical protein
MSLSPTASLVMRLKLSPLTTRFFSTDAFQKLNKIETKKQRETVVPKMSRG